MEIHGHAGHRPEINGVYVPLRECWAGRLVYLNRRTQVYLVWNAHPARWRVVARLGSPEALAYADASEDPGALPCQVRGPWFVTADRAEEGEGAQAEADGLVQCSFVGQTVIVSGRAGHNQRLNGVFAELPEAYGSFPAYADRQQHMFIYRRLDRASWVISNRLGPAIRSGHGTVFAEVADEAPQPYLVRRPWTVSAWGRREAEDDPNISVFLRADGGPGASPPSVLTVRSRLHPDVAGTYVVQQGQRANGCALYLRSGHSSDPQKLIFWDGERWCIGQGAALDGSEQCDACAQRRDVCGRKDPDDAIWPGIEVLRGDSDVIHATLLAKLRGHTSSMTKLFV